MSQQSVPEWMPLYVYEFLADINVQAMDLDELGAYFLLVMCQWVNGSIPSDKRILARLCRNRDEATMERIWTALKPCYSEHPSEPGVLIQKRVEEEREVALSRLAGSKKGGLASAESRRKKQDKPGRTVRDSAAPIPAQLEMGREVANDDHWAEFKRLYPSHRFDEQMACQMFLPHTDGDVIVAGLKRAVASEDWTKEDGKYVPWASRFIADGKYTGYKALPVEKKPTFFDPTSITGGSK